MQYFSLQSSFMLATCSMPLRNIREILEAWEERKRYMLKIDMWWWMNCYCVTVDWQKAFNLISSRDHCQRSSPSQISDTPRAGFEPAQNLSSGFVEWSCAVVMLHNFMAKKKINNILFHYQIHTLEKASNSNNNNVNYSFYLVQ